MMPHVEIERMGHGHALTVALTWKLEPGELDELKTNTDYRESLAYLFATDAHAKLNNHLSQLLQRAKTP